jgi:hypothetical protein
MVQICHTGGRVSMTQPTTAVSIIIDTAESDLKVEYLGEFKPTYEMSLACGSYAQICRVVEKNQRSKIL